MKITAEFTEEEHKYLLNLVNIFDTMFISEKAKDSRKISEIFYKIYLALNVDNKYDDILNPKLLTELINVVNTDEVVYELNDLEKKLKKVKKTIQNLNKEGI